MRRSTAATLATALALALGACGGLAPDNPPPAATATAIPTGAPGATGVPIGSAPAGGPAPLQTPGDPDEQPHGVPQNPFAPEPPQTPVPPSAAPHGPAKKPPKGIHL